MALGAWNFETMTLLDHMIMGYGTMGPWGFETEGLWDHGSLGPSTFGTVELLDKANVDHVYFGLRDLGGIGT